MRKTLFATSALALAGAVAAAPASAADEMPEKLTVSVGGYMQQWIGVSDLDNAADSGGVSQYSDSELFFRGTLEADNGLTFSVKIEFEGNTHPDVVDESQATVSGSFGQIVLGSEDDPAALMHYSVQDVGVGIACGDAGFINGLAGCPTAGAMGIGTNGWIIGGDKQKIAYYTPRMSGVQLGLSYSPESVEDSGAGSPLNNDNDAVALGLNYTGQMADTSVALSFGHYQRSQTGATEMLKSGTNDAAITVGTYMANTAAIEAYATAQAEGTAGSLDSLANDAAAAEASNMGAFDTMASRADEHTFTNFGIRVGMGAFGFSAAYLTHDGGSYMVASSPIVNIVSGHSWDHDGDADTADVAESGDNNDPSNDTARSVLVKNTARDYEVMGAGAMYSDGPMAVSLAHTVAEADDGSSASSTMLSLSYSLAPGIASRTTLMAGDQNGVEGTAFVTGITLGF